MKKNIFDMKEGPSDALYDWAYKLSNKILIESGVGLCWDDLPDTNSLWEYLYDVSDEQTLFDQVSCAVCDRLYDSDYGNINETEAFVRSINVLSLKDLK